MENLLVTNSGINISICRKGVSYPSPNSTTVEFGRGRWCAVGADDLERALVNEIIMG